MANAIIAGPNRADEMTLAGGSWSSTLPLANLQSRFIDVVARTADATLASSQFTATFTKQRPTRVVALVGHSFSTAAKYRLRLFDDAAQTITNYDSGWVDVWGEVYATLSLEWEQDSFWSGTIDPEDLDGFAKILTAITPGTVFCRSMKLEIDDTTNSAGCVDIGRLFVGSGFQPVINMSNGASLRYETETKVKKSLGGVKHFDKRDQYRVARFALDNMSQDEAMGKAFDLVRLASIDAEVFYIFDPDDTTHKIRRCFMGNLRQLNEIEATRYDNYRTVMEVEEVI